MAPSATTRSWRRRAVKAYRRTTSSPRRAARSASPLNGDATLPWDPEDPADVRERATARSSSPSAVRWSLYFGRYPDSMLKQLGDRLPSFPPGGGGRCVQELQRLLRQNRYGQLHQAQDWLPARGHSSSASLETSLLHQGGRVHGPETSRSGCAHSPGIPRPAQHSSASATAIPRST